jgi:hypothetical protein
MDGGSPFATLSLKEGDLTQLVVTAGCLKTTRLMTRLPTTLQLVLQQRSQGQRVQRAEKGFQLMPGNALKVVLSYYYSL